jgi:hypothetical protein
MNSILYLSALLLFAQLCQSAPTITTGAFKQALTSAEDEIELTTEKSVETKEGGSEQIWKSLEQAVGVTESSEGGDLFEWENFVDKKFRLIAKNEPKKF